MSAPCCLSFHEAQNLPAADTGVGGMAHAAPGVTVVLEQAVERDTWRGVTGVMEMVFILKPDPPHGPASATPLSRLGFPSECEHRASPGPWDYGGQSVARKGGHGGRARTLEPDPWETSWREGHNSIGLEGSPWESVTGAWLRSSMTQCCPGPPMECRAARVAEWLGWCKWPRQGNVQRGEGSGSTSPCLRQQ